MPDLKDYITPKEIVLYIKELKTEDTLDQVLFPNRHVDGTEIEMAKGSKQKAVALRQSTFDVKAKVRALNTNVDITKKEMPYFKEAVTVSEKDKRKLIDASLANNQNVVNFMLSQIYDNYAGMVQGAHINAKKMRCSVIQNGCINFTSKDGDIVVDYGIPSNHKVTLTGNDKWTNPAADIVGDIKAYQKIMTNENYPKPNTLLMTEKTFDDTFMVNTAIINDIKNSNLNNLRILSQKDFITFAKERLGINIVFEEDTVYYTEVGGPPISYYENNKVTFISSTTLGETQFGTTPEEYDMATRKNKFPTEIIAPGIAICTEELFDPCTVSTKVSVMPMVSFEKADEVFFATVG